MQQRTAKDAIVEQLCADGIRYVFGNPGTVEQGLLDSIERHPDLDYVLALHETAAVGMADGYARATRRPTVVQLHTGVGLGNGIGMLYQAKRGHSPLVVLAGEAGLRYDAMDSQMAADLVGMARPVTKWATRVVDPSSVLRVLRRAIKVASTAPAGPVFVSLPMDVLDALTTEPAAPTTVVDTRVAPTDQAVRTAAQRLLAGHEPLIIAGDGVAASGAHDELGRLAEVLGAQVWGADWSEVNLDPGHPLYSGQLGHMFGEQSREVIQRADAVLICGTYLFPEVFPLLESVFGEDTQVVHIDLDTWEIAKNFPVAQAIAADPKLTLGLLADAVEQLRGPGQQAEAQERVRRSVEDKQRAQDAAARADADVRDLLPLRASRFATELAELVPEDAIFFDESLTSSPEIFRYLTPARPGQLFQTRGGSLGVGMPGTIGVQLANPGRTVIGLVGDGGSLYTAESLWSAARYRVPAKFVICNNGSYELLRLNIEQYWREREVPHHEFPASFDLSEPAIDFVGLAASFGVSGERVATAEEIRPAIERALAHPGPYLIDLVIADHTTTR